MRIYSSSDGVMQTERFRSVSEAHESAGEEWAAKESEAMNALFQWRLIRSLRFPRRSPGADDRP